MYRKREVIHKWRAQEMITPTQSIKRHLLLGIWLAIISSVDMGCGYLPESTFTLAGGSRLPKWVTLPPGLTRADVSLAMSYYIRPWGSSAQFTLRSKNGRVMMKEDGKVRCKEPFQLKSSPQQPPSGYLTYEPISINGITEIIEHRKMEPTFYVTDNSAVWKQYQSIGCG
jgi:hypothetical protein